MTRTTESKDIIIYTRNLKRKLTNDFCDDYSNMSGVYTDNKDTCITGLFVDYSGFSVTFAAHLVNTARRQVNIFTVIKKDFLPVSVCRCLGGSRSATVVTRNLTAGP